MNPVKMDDIDRQILTIIQNEGRVSNKDLAERIGLTTTPTLERVKRLEKEGDEELHHLQRCREHRPRGVQRWIHAVERNAACRHGLRRARAVLELLEFLRRPDHRKEGQP